MIVTFYSFKGGVGRTMAMANVAELLADAGYSVIVCDWDLEAPGLERYFTTDERRVEDLRSKRGLMDLLLDYKAFMTKPGAPEERGDWLEQLENPLTVLQQVGDPERGTDIRILTAGRRFPYEAMQEYARAVRSFKWGEFYDRWAGGAYFEFVRTKLNQEGSRTVVLVDSRTGVTEHGGVCTHHLADVVVLLSAANQANQRGTVWMARKLSNPELIERRGGRPLHLLPVPARIETIAEKEFLVRFRREFHETASPFVTGLVPDPTAFLEAAEIPYVSYYSFGEQVVAREAEGTRHPQLLAAYKHLASAVATIGVRTEQLRTAPREERLPTAVSSRGELAEMLKAHREWLTSKGNHGERAVLDGRDLSRRDVAGATLARASLVGTDLSFADLSEADLADADLTRANLPGAKLRGSHLAFANLQECNLTQADLTGAALVGTDLSRANLENARFTRARFEDVDLTGALLAGADFDGAVVEGDFSTALGLSARQRRGLIVASTGTLPPVQERSYAYDAYISYRHGGIEDEVAKLLSETLEARGLKIWDHDRDLLGQDIADSLATALSNARWLILIIGNARTSEWSRAELDWFQRDRSEPQVLPLLLGPGAHVVLAEEYPAFRDTMAVDLSWVERGARDLIGDPRFQVEARRVEAVLRGVELKNIIAAEEARRQAARRTAWTAALVFAAFATASGGYAYQRVLANDAVLQEQNRLARAAQVDDDPSRRVVLAAEALLARPNQTPSLVAMNAMEDAVNRCAGASLGVLSNDLADLALGSDDRIAAVDVRGNLRVWESWDRPPIESARDVANVSPTAELRFDGTGTTLMAVWREGIWVHPGAPSWVAHALERVAWSGVYGAWLGPERLIINFDDRVWVFSSVGETAQLDVPARVELGSRYRWMSTTIEQDTAIWDLSLDDPFAEPVLAGSLRLLSDSVGVLAIRTGTVLPLQPRGVERNLTDWSGGPVAWRAKDGTVFVTRSSKQSDYVVWRPQQSPEGVWVHTEPDHEEIRGVTPPPHRLVTTDRDEALISITPLAGQLSHVEQGPLRGFASDWSLMIAGDPPTLVDFRASEDNTLLGHSAATRGDRWAVGPSNDLVVGTVGDQLRMWSVSSTGRVLAPIVLEGGHRCHLARVMPGSRDGTWSLECIEDAGRTTTAEVDVDQMLVVAMQVAGRNLTTTEWGLTMPDRTYRPTWRSLQ